MSKVALDDDSLLDLMRKGGVDCQRVAKGTFIGRFRAKGQTFPLHAHVDPSGFVTLAVVPLLKSPPTPEACERLFTRLLVLNRQMTFAKFAVDDDLDVFLCVDYPVADLDESEIRDALDVLAVYAVEHRDALVALAAS